MADDLTIYHVLMACHPPTDLLLHSVLTTTTNHLHHSECRQQNTWFHCNSNKQVLLFYVSETK